MTFPDEVLMAYADDELDPLTREAVEAAMACDPEVARRIAQHKALRTRVQAAFDTVQDEPVPARLLQAAQTEPAHRGSGEAVPLRPRRQRNWYRPEWAAIAASLIVGFMTGRLMLLPTGAPDPIVVRSGELVAAGAVADALSTQLAADATAAGPVRVGISFRSKSGEYCRTFSLRQPALGGLACRAADGWRVGVLARAESSGAGPDTYRQAASALPAAVVAAVGNQIAGEPLDAHAEAAARARHWRP